MSKERNDQLGVYSWGQAELREFNPFAPRSDKGFDFSTLVKDSEIAAHSLPFGNYETPEVKGDWGADIGPEAYGFRS